MRNGEIFPHNLYERALENSLATRRSLFEQRLASTFVPELQMLI
jgi:hypothetical protein